MNFSQNDIDRFWSKVDKKGDDECWNWLACLDKGGYGRFWFNGKTVKAHRCSLVLAHAVQPLNKTWALHTCLTNPKCVNPNHLYYGNQPDNERDKVKDGTHARGERNGCCKLTEQQVRDIREKYIPHKYSTHKLAKEYEISQSQIKMIINNKSWKHVE